ncbi:hypothetical protein C6341_g7502 [Phytophthora cactorum]|nr:hypothetical protein C6341_g7502 [Phytophthora cactorum]
MSDVDDSLKTNRLRNLILTLSTTTRATMILSPRPTPTANSDSTMKYKKPSTRPFNRRDAKRAKKRET